MSAVYGVTYNMEEGWVGRKNDQKEKEITSQTADKHGTIRIEINKLKGDAQKKKC